MKGHPVFKAQHACGCCCRGCLEKWYRVKKGCGLTEAQLSDLRICLDAFARNMDRITNGDDKNEAR